MTTAIAPASHCGPFGIVPAALLFDQRISAEAVRVYAALATHANEHRECYPRQESIARRLGVTQGTVSQHLAVLVAHGYVLRETRRDPGQRHATNHYRLLTDVPPTMATTPPATGAAGPISPTNISPTNISGANNKNIPVEEEQTMVVQGSVSPDENHENISLANLPPTTYAHAHTREEAPARERESDAWIPETRTPEPRTLPPVVTSAPLEHAPDHAAQAISDAMAAHMAPPITHRGRVEWWAAVTELQEASASPDAVRYACRRWREKGWNWSLNPAALCKHLAVLLEGSHYAQQYARANDESGGHRPGDARPGHGDEATAEETRRARDELAALVDALYGPAPAR